MVFSPEKQKIYCPYCESEDCEEQKGDDSLTQCSSCGGEIKADEFASTTQCPYCGNYIIFDKRISNEYRPDKVIPFKLSKEDAVGVLEEKCAGHFFTPSSFLSEKTLVDMSGYYVPFFMYDYHVDKKYVGDATKRRSWREGNYECTETSYYKLYRELKVDFDNVPVDASIAMHDKTMDQLEPFDYQLLTDFDPRVMSGFLAETYNMTKDELAERAEKKIAGNTNSIMMNSMTGYSLSKPEVNTQTMQQGKTEFVLLPVWKYIYFHEGKFYDYYVNGESGKVIGEIPVSRKKVFIYGLTCAALWGIILDAILGLLGGLLL